MSINSRGRSHIDGNRALKLFTDRHELTRVFADYLHDEPADKILSFSGDGGNGKSLLLKFLRIKCCKRFAGDIWQKLKTKTAAEVADYIKDCADSDKFHPVPAILHDFGLRPNGDEQPQIAKHRQT